LPQVLRQTVEYEASVGLVCFHLFLPFMLELSLFMSLAAYGLPICTYQAYEGLIPASILLGKLIVHLTAYNRDGLINSVFRVN